MYINVVYALSCALLWSGITISSKMLSGSLPGLVFAFLRYFVAVVVLIPFIPYRETKEIKTRSMLWLLFLGLNAVVIWNVFFFTGLSYTTPTTASLIQAGGPIFILLASALIERRLPTKHQLFAFLLSFCGVAMVIMKGQIGFEVFKASIGEFLILGAVLSGVFYILALKKMSAHFSPMFLTFATGIAGLILLIPVLLNIHFVEALSSLSSFDWMLFAYIGILGTALGNSIYSIAVKNLGAPMTGLLVFSTMPLFVGILSYFILGNTLSVWQVVGGALILAGLFWGLMKHQH